MDEWGEQSKGSVDVFIVVSGTVFASDSSNVANKGVCPRLMLRDGIVIRHVTKRYGS